MTKQISVEVEGYSSQEEPQVFEILSRAEVEKAIEALSHEEIYRAAWNQTGYECSGTAYAYLDARDGKLKSSWLGANTWNHPFDSFYEIWLCILKTGAGGIDIDDPELLLSDDEQEEFRTYHEGYASDFVREKFGEKELEDREETVLDMLAGEYEPDSGGNDENIEQQVTELYKKIVLPWNRKK